ncbi:Hsp20/alpha crystallin family protein [Halovivax limisalsi]|uniref:Hsp20/alpha crystallin family protein n=1 Tax=Halovivax limisalsi TaxID=1453760 RepID=UPI001FFD8344|nr:Hsp20/alpha crystallin family protein [Halovivax limisalsi]
MNPQSLLESGREHLHRQVGRLARSLQSIRSLDADLLENETSYLVVVDAPGVRAADLDIRYVDGRISISSDRSLRESVGFTRHYVGRTRSLSGSITLPDDAVVDPEAAEARLSRLGTVNITLPKDSPADRPDSAVGEEIPIDD